MPFQRNYLSLIINGVIYSKKELLELILDEELSKNEKTEDWRKSFYQFVEEWVNEENYVTVNTSGSTGQPKAIQLSKKRMMQSAFMTGKYFNFKSGQRALLCLPCDYIAGKMMVVRAMVWGLDLQLVPPTGNPMANSFQPLDFAAMVPLQVTNLIDQSPEKFSLIKQLIIGGGKVDANLLDQLQTVPTRCFATYGMTETITHVAIKTLNGPQKTPYFEGLQNIKFTTDERDCLIIEAPLLAEQPVVTNDIVQLKNDHQFEWLGRFDNVINTGGVKVFPEKIEAKLEKLIKNRFFVTSLPDKKLENKVILIIEDTPWINRKTKALLIDLKRILTKFECPKHIYFLDTFELTPTKKIQRNRTKEKLIKFNL